MTEVHLYSAWPPILSDLYLEVPVKDVELADLAHAGHRRILANRSGQYQSVALAVFRYIGDLVRNRLLDRVEMHGCPLMYVSQKCRLRSSCQTGSSQARFYRRP